MFFCKTSQTSEYQFIFVVSTGRCGTKHLAEIFGDKYSVVVHEEEHTNNYKVLSKFLRPIASNNDRKLAIDYLKNYRIPFMLKKLRKNRATTFFETGHLINYGIIPYLLTHLENIKLIRLRRNQVETTLSFLTRPPELDLWNNDNNPMGPYRWSMHPFDKINRLPITPENWQKFSRFQKYLWSIDEVERQWQHLKKNFSFPYIEIKMEDFGKNVYDKVSKFTGVNYDPYLMGIRHNSTSSKGFKKPKFSPQNIEKELLNYQQIIHNLNSSPILK